MKLAMLPIKKIVLFIFLYGMFAVRENVSAQVCQGSLGDPVVHIDFGRGSSPIGPSLGSATNYTYVASEGPSDGFYTIEKRITPGGAWHNISNHTPNDPNGYMMTVNASYEPGIFYETAVDTDLCPNTTYEFAAWISNLMTFSGIKPKITFLILTMDDQELGRYSTGAIPESPSGTWKQYGFLFSTPFGVTRVKIRIRNEAAGGVGNDLVLDDITFRPCGPKITTVLTHSGLSGGDLCQDESIRISASVEGGTGLQYMWQKFENGDWTDLITERSPEINFSPAALAIGNHKYRLVTASGNNLSSPLCRTASAEVEIPILSAAPVAVAGPDVSVCEGSSVTLSASGGTIYKWTPDTGLSNSHVPNPIASPEKSTVYTVAVSNGGCKDTASVRVTVIGKISTNAGKNKVIIEGQSILLDGQVTGDSVRYFWTPSDHLDDPLKLNPVATPVKDITYTLNAWSEAGCTGSIANVAVKVYPRLEIPNTISPNGDNINDVWNIPALEAYPNATIDIYNRYGEKVFSSANNLKQWNGKHKGKDVPVGIYYYVIRLQAPEQSVTGSLMVLR